MAKRVVLFAVVLFAGFLPARLSARPLNSGERCAAAKVKAAGKKAAAKLACHASAARTGATVSASCLGKAAAKFADEYAKAEAKGPCLSTGDAATEEAIVDQLVGDVVAALRPSQGANGCAAAKLTATGKKAASVLTCQGSGILHAGVDASCRTRAEAKFTAAFARAEAAPPCLTTGDATGVEAGVEAGEADVLRALRVPVARVNVTSTGRPGVSQFSSGGTATLSDDDRFVAFDSGDTNLAPGMQGTLFIRDRLSGVTSHLDANGDALMLITPDARFAIFHGYLPDTPLNHVDLIVADRDLGTLEAANIDEDGTRSLGFSFGFAISADGRFVAIQTDDSMVTADTNQAIDVFVRDRQSATTVRASVADDESQATGACFLSGMSDDGRLVAFWSGAANLVPGDTNGRVDVFVRDIVLQTTERVSVASDGTEGDGNSGAVGAVLSPDGRFVAFSSDADNFDGNPAHGVFLRDRMAGKTERVSNGFAPFGISLGGRFVGYRGGINGDHLFVHDRQLGTDEEMGEGGEATLSRDGRFVAFAGIATDIVANDTNHIADIFLVDRGPIP